MSQDLESKSVEPSQEIGKGDEYRITSEIADDNIRAMKINPSIFFGLLGGLVIGAEIVNLRR